MYDVRRYYRTVSRFMDLELAERGDAELWQRVGRRAGSILEVGCGSGRVTAALASADARVLGIDLSPELLAIARQRLSGRPNVWLLLADIRNLALLQSFDAIVAPDDPFSHLVTDEDRDQALATIRSLLTPGGRLTLDALWFKPDEERRGAQPDGRKDQHQVQGLTVKEQWRCDPHTHRCSTSFDYEEEGGERAEARFEARYWTEAEIRARFQRAGLAIEGWYGGYAGESWDPERSSHLIVEARPGSD